MSTREESAESVRLKSFNHTGKRLGFVGVGKHAKRLADTFLELGAQIVAHDRQSDAPGPEWAGKRMAWREMVCSRKVDALVVVAPPEATSAVVALAAKANGMPAIPVLATKPLVWPSPLDWAVDVLGSRIHVDLWRLHSPAWQAMKAELQGKAIDSIEVICVGDGPVRSFSGVLDYGPHALAFVGDLLGSVPELHIGSRSERLEWNRDKPTRRAVSLYSYGLPDIRVRIGNDALKPETRVTVSAGPGRETWTWVEVGYVQSFSWLAHGEIGTFGGEIVSNDRDLALRSFCRSFLAGEPSDTLRLSCEGMRVLQKVTGQ